MKKTNAGIIAILANFKSPEMRKVLDVKVTSGYPTVTILSGFTLFIPELKITSLGYQHITIPPDLNVHITGNSKSKIWAPRIKDLVTKEGKLNVEFQKILTVVFPPLSDFPIFTNRIYKGAMIIGFSQLSHWNEQTSFVLELFALRTHNINIPIDDHYIGDQGAYMPWLYSEIGKTFDEPHKRGQFWIRQFVITNHDPKPSRTVTVYFGDIYKNKLAK